MTRWWWRLVTAGTWSRSTCGCVGRNVGRSCRHHMTRPRPPCLGVRAHAGTGRRGGVARQGAFSAAYFHVQLPPWRSAWHRVHVLGRRHACCLAAGHGDVGGSWQAGAWRQHLWHRRARGLLRHLTRVSSCLSHLCMALPRLLAPDAVVCRFGKSSRRRHLQIARRLTRPSLLAPPSVYSLLQLLSTSTPEPPTCRQARQAQQAQQAP